MGAIALRENIQQYVANSGFEWNGKPLPLSVSIGESARRMNPDKTDVESAPAEEGDEDDEVASLSLREELAELLEEADAALFVAKRGVRLAPIPNERGADISSDPDSLENIPGFSN